MKLDAFLKIAKVLPLFALLVVYGCGGGSGTTASVPSTMDPGSGTEMPGSGTEMPGSGGGPAHEGPTLTEAFATQQDQNYSLSNASLARDNNAGATSISGSFRVTSIQRTSAGGYTVVYQDGNDQGTATFSPEQCVDGYCSYTDTGSGQFYGFFSSTSTTNGEPLGEPSEFTYLAPVHLDVGGTRSYFVFGLGTTASAIPATGEAIYSGRFRADAYRAGSTSNSFRQRYSGNLRLVANFDMSQLTGQIFRVYGSAPGSSTRNSWPTSSFTVTNGQFSNGQYTATLTGVDSDSSVPDAESVRGFLGSIVAKFYGPNAEEIGGTVTATRDLANSDNDLILYGYVGGRKLAPRVFGSAAFVAGTTRRFDDQESEVFADVDMAAVEKTANGWRVTVGGRTFTFADSAYLSNPGRFPFEYFFTDASGARVFWTWTNGFSSTSRFDHFDVKGWGTAEPDLDNADVSDTLYLVHGNRTAQNAMPTSGTATYTGEMGAREYPSDQAVSTRNPAAIRYRGTARLTANFATSSVAGAFSNLEKQPGNSGAFVSANGDATFNAQINGNGLTASDLTGTGDLAGYQNGGVRGSFFGPAAEEMGGVFDAQDTSGNRVISGYFGAKKDQ